MRRPTSKRLLQAASLLLAALTALFTTLWVVRGLRPAIDCGLMAAIARGDWPAAYACIDLADYKALLAVLALAGSVLTWVASRTASDTPIGEFNPAELTRYRRAVIDRVQANWIDGWLDQTLYQSVLMHLGMIWRRAGEQERPVPADVPSILHFFKAKHRLLILGEPGSGKTTIMLDLARALLEQARADATVPIPVVFNLASFTEAEQSFADWLVGEFRRSDYDYDIHENLARYWLAHNEIALLLDGLDEVPDYCRARVVEKINRYRSDPQKQPPWLVISCRNNVHDELRAMGLDFADMDTVVLQPLAPDQIESYLLAKLDGPEPRRLWSALQGDAFLLEVADTPHMLNVMLLAADALDWDTLPAPRTPEAVRSYIYDTYIRSMLGRHRKVGAHNPPAKTLHWLHWLADKMVEQGQSVFLLERMDRRWFNHPWQRYIWVLIFGLIFGMLGGMLGGMLTGLIFALIGGLFFGLSDSLIGEVIFGPNGPPNRFGEDYRRSQPSTAIRQSLLFGMLGGLSFALSAGLFFGRKLGLSAGLSLALSSGLLFGLVFGWEAVIRHYTLRLLLFLNGSMPLDYVRFLDDCADRILLRRFGGGYYFIHRTFMEHMAGLDPDAPEWRSES